MTSAYGLNDTCHVLLYMGDAAPYRLTLLEKSTGNLSLSTGQCDAMVIQLQNNGEYSAGNGTGPSDAGLASKYGYKGCVVGVSWRDVCWTWKSGLMGTIGFVGSG